MVAAATVPLKVCHVRTSDLDARLVDQTGLPYLYLTTGSNVS